MIEKSKIIQLTEEFFEGTDKYIVELHIKTNNVINLFIDANESVSINDCVDLSRYIESNLDREMEDFELNVSSAGLDQPFKHLKQYQKNINKEISVLKSDGKKIKGILLEASEESILIEIPENKKKKIEKQELSINLSDIKETKSIISFKK